MIKCSFCGHEFEEHEGVAGCASCPMHKNCNKHKCPNCGFEIPKEPKLISVLKKWRKKNV